MPADVPNQPAASPNGNAGADSHIKQTVPDAILVAEMMSADWCREQVILAAEAGADIVLLIGPATVANVSVAVSGGFSASDHGVVAAPDWDILDQQMCASGIDRR
ncbi:hypothetical protein [Dactylosporangium sp. NPDC050588]|uniref:hypothetical protein n=1 Tax=Dactylosporangium sp. NPDC050588 TaxID=3157211 RepID=UPI0033D63012